MSTSRTPKLEDLKVGDVLMYWHDSGCFGMKNVYARVIKVGAKKVQVASEVNPLVTGWKYPWWFDSKVDEKTVAELRTDGVRI